MKCLMCAKCCEHYNGLITVSKEEVDEYRKNGMKDVIKFLKWDGRHYLAWYDEKGRKLPKCPFLNKENKCLIHEVKPVMCRKFNCSEHPGFLKIYNNS